MRQVLSWLDMPPVWLFGFIAAAYGLELALPTSGPGIAGMRLLGNGLIGLGFSVMGLAAWEFLRARTTIIPRRTASALLTRGIFGLTRNPIYLGDALVLTGVILRWDVVPALVLVPCFIWLVTRRFILGEEVRLAEAFGQEFVDWTARVRRWI